MNAIPIKIIKDLIVFDDMISDMIHNKKLNSIVTDQIRDEKLQYGINREAAKKSASSSGKIHKYEYLTGEDILPSNKQQVIEQARFTYSTLRKAFEK